MALNDWRYISRISREKDSKEFHFFPCADYKWITAASLWIYYAFLMILYHAIAEPRVIFYEMATRQLFVVEHSFIWYQIKVCNIIHQISENILQIYIDMITLNLFKVNVRTSARIAIWPSRGWSVSRNTRTARRGSFFVRSAEKLSEEKAREIFTSVLIVEIDVMRADSALKCSWQIR